MWRNRVTSERQDSTPTAIQTQVAVRKLILMEPMATGGNISARALYTEHGTRRGEAPEPHDKTLVGLQAALQFQRERLRERGKNRLWGQERWMIMISLLSLAEWM